MFLVVCPLLLPRPPGCSVGGQSAVAHQVWDALTLKSCTHTQHLMCYINLQPDIDQYLLNKSIHTSQYFYSYVYIKFDKEQNILRETKISNAQNLCTFNVLNLREMKHQKISYVIICITLETVNLKPDKRNTNLLYLVNMTSDASFIISYKLEVI